MSAVLYVGALVLAAVLLLLWALHRQAGRAEAEAYERERALMPVELRQAELVVSEQTLFADDPVPLVARVDQVFYDGTWLIPVETKTRKRVHVVPSDLLELGVQAVVLAVQTRRGLAGLPVAPFGYVRVVTPHQEPRYLKVDLPSRETVEAYYHRFLDLHAGRVQPRPPFNAAVCRDCPHADRCPLVGTVGKGRRGRPRYVPDQTPGLTGVTT